MKNPTDCPVDASEYFKAAVERLKGRKVANLRKVAYKLSADGIPIRHRTHRKVEDSRVSLDAPELSPPYFWMPGGFDGEAWKVELCAPKWFSDDEAKRWRKQHRERFKETNHGQVSQDSEDYVRERLASLRALSKPNEKHPRVAGLASTAAVYLNDAIIEGQALEDGQGTDERIARIIEKAFRAGECSARASLRFSGFVDDSRKANDIVKRMGKGKACTKRERLPTTEGSVVDFMEKNPNLGNPAILKLIAGKVGEGKPVEFREHIKKTHRFKGGAWIAKDGIYSKLRELRRRYLHVQ